MSFQVLSGLSKKGINKPTSGAAFWSAISNLQNDSFGASVAGKRLSSTLKKDVAIRSAVGVLKQARNNFTKYGATEAAMALFNQDDQLAKSLNISIPKVNSVNAVAIGKTCCKRINSKISETITYANHYGNTVAAQTATLINKTSALSNTQKQVLELLYNRVANDIKVINAKQFNRSVICGYTRPVFVDRVSSLQFIIDNLHRCNSVAQCRKTFGKQFAILGWNVTDDGEVVEATPEEVAEAAPSEDEVMTPVTDPDTGEVVKEDEDDNELVKVPEADETEVAASEPQEQPMAIFGWTPVAIKQATGSLHKLTNYVTKLSNAYSNVVAAKKKLRTSAESYSAAIEKAPVFTTIENCRKYNTLVGSLIVRYNDATTELVNQAVAMYGVLKDAEVFPTSAHAVSVKSITAKTPWGLRRGKGFFNEDALPEGDANGETDESGAELPGELEDDTEGPTKAEEPVENAAGPGPVVDVFNYDDEDTIPEGDANGEEDAAGVELPGDLEDETEGPTKAEAPDGETSDHWSDLNKYFNEDDEAETKEETADEGDEENEDEEDDEKEEAEAAADDDDGEAAAEDEPKDDDDKDDADDKPSSEGYGFFDEDADLPEGDANGEEDAAGVELPGDLEDDTEGPTKAIEPEDYRFVDEDGDDVVEDGEVPADDEAAGEPSEEPAEPEELAGDEPAEAPEDVPAEDDSEGADANPMVNFSYLDQDENGDDAAEPEAEQPAEDEAAASDDDTSDLDAVDPSGDEEADGSDDIKDGLETDPNGDEYVAAPEGVSDDEEDADTSAVDFLDEDGDIVGPETPDEFPTEPTDTPEGVDPNGEVDIPDAQTEPYMQPESTPPKDVPKTTIENRRRQYFE